MRNYFPDKSKPLPEPDGSYDKTKWKEIDMNPQEREEKFKKIEERYQYEVQKDSAVHFLLSEVKPPQLFKAEDFKYKFTPDVSRKIAQDAQAIFEKWFNENVIFDRDVDCFMIPGLNPEDDGTTDNLLKDAFDPKED